MSGVIILWGIIALVLVISTVSAWAPSVFIGQMFYGEVLECIVLVASQSFRLAPISKVSLWAYSY